MWWFVFGLVFGVCDLIYFLFFEMPSGTFVVVMTQYSAPSGVGLLFARKKYECYWNFEALKNGVRKYDFKVIIITQFKVNTVDGLPLPLDRSAPLESAPVHHFA